MSEYSIQFWVMVGTLVTAAGTLILGIGVIIAGLQFRHSRRAPDLDRRRTAVQTYLASKSILVMRAKSSRWKPGDVENSISAMNLLVSEFKLAGTGLQASLLSVDMLVSTLMKEIVALTPSDSGEAEGDPADSRRVLLVRVIVGTGRIIEKLLEKRPKFDQIANELDLFVKQQIETLEGVSDDL